jgi:hypothetical protein
MAKLTYQLSRSTQIIFFYSDDRSSGRCAIYPARFRSRPRTGRPRRSPDVSAAGAPYSANTAGAAAGAITAGFWLIPIHPVQGRAW